MSYKKAFWIILAIIVVIGSAITSFLILSHVATPLPSGIEKALTFSPFVPYKNNGDFSVARSTLSRSEDGKQLLAYTLKIPSTSLVITQSVEPSQFAEVPEFKTRFLSSVISDSHTVQTASGVIYTGRAAKQNDKQIGIMTEHGLLIFLNPARDLSDVEWRSVGDALTVKAIAR